jgi:hypothetical protein
MNCIFTDKAQMSLVFNTNVNKMQQCSFSFAAEKENKK